MKTLFSLIIFIGFISYAQTSPPKQFGAVPSKQQLEWHKMEYYAFIHFTINTFTNKEWGEGTESAESFNPSNLDCRQWARTIKEAGMKGIIITAKHHDGFCLWPSKFSTHTIRESNWKNGKGDILRELSNACKEFGLKFGVYVSPWDRNHPTYGTDEYNNTFKNTLTEVLTNYGEIFEVWFDGANGEGPNGKKQIYDWNGIFETVRKYQPNALIFGPVHPDIRWVGNEEGYANETNWATMDKMMTESSAGLKELNTGKEDGTAWIPSEVDVSIRPGWFYHKSEDSKVKSLNKLVDIYFSSVGRGSNLLLNVPPDRRGLIHENDINALKQLKNYLTACFKNNLASVANAAATNIRGNSKYFSPSLIIDKNKDSFWSTDDNINTASLYINFNTNLSFNCIEIEEYIALGQRIKSFSVEAYINGYWKNIFAGTTIGYKKLIRFPLVKSNKIKINILESKASPVISNIAIYKIPELIDPPEIKRNKNGIVSLRTESPQAIIYYTADGTKPNKQSILFKKPFEVKNECIIKAIAFNGDYTKSSAVVTAEFGICKENWKIVSVDDEHKDLKAGFAIDDDPSTFWHTHWSGDFKIHPHEMIIDLGAEYILTGFTYLPRQDGNNSGNITTYDLLISSDNKRWVPAIINGAFANIANNPIMQIVSFIKSESVRYLKLVTHGDSKNNGWVNAAEIGIITRK